MVMSALLISVIVFLCVLSSALLGMLFAPNLAASHRTAESKDVVRLGMGLVSTTVAVALGLLISSAKSFYDTQSSEVTQLAANYILLDEVLETYGTETAELRAGLRTDLADLVDPDGYVQGAKKSNKSYGDIRSGTRIGGNLIEAVQRLSPKDDNQRSMKAQALNLFIQLGQTRWLIFEQNTVPVPKLLLYMLVGWLIVLFASFGIYAPRNFTVFAGLLLAALAVSGAMLLILEMYHPQTGLIRVSDAPLRAALAQVGG
jgi:hypothetical protein